LTDEERSYLEQMSRASSAPAVQVRRAKRLLAVAAGAGYRAAARAEGRRSGEAVTQLGIRFNRDGVEALDPRHGGGSQVVYGLKERDRIIAEVRRQPDREMDGTASWSLSTLQRALRAALEGLPTLSRETTLNVLHEAGWSWQKDRSWGETGKGLRKRKAGTVEVTDPRTRGQENMIERAYQLGETLGLAVWGMDEAGPYTTPPDAGTSWQVQNHARRYPHE
jgi:transposase